MIVFDRASALVRRINGPFKEFGFVAGLLFVIGRAISEISPRMRLFYYELMVQPIVDKPVMAERRGRQIEIREIKPGDAELALMPVGPEVIEWRRKQDTICLGAFLQDKLVGYIWFCFGAYLEDEVLCTYELSPQHESVFDFDLYIFPASRLGPAFVRIWDGANRYLRQRNIKYTFSRISRFNTATRRAHAHLGCKLAGRALILKLWNAEFLVATVPPYLHVSLGESGRARLKLNADALRA